VLGLGYQHIKPDWGWGVII
jgi:hypothetical protein